MHYSGYFIQEVGEGLSRVIAISNCDIGGRVPKMAVKGATAISMPKMVKELKNCMDKYYKKEG